MKKILLSIAAVSALAATTVPAAALAQPINQRQDQIEHRIDRGLRDGSLTRTEAARLRSQLRDTVRIEYRYRANGLNGWERTDLDRRFDRITAQLHVQRRDRDRTYGYGYDAPRPYRY